MANFNQQYSTQTNYDTQHLKTYKIKEDYLFNKIDIDELRQKMFDLRYGKIMIENHIKNWSEEIHLMKEKYIDKIYDKKQMMDWMLKRNYSESSIKTFLDKWRKR
jgi:hypothetical protein